MQEVVWIATLKQQVSVLISLHTRNKLHLDELHTLKQSSSRELSLPY